MTKNYSNAFTAYPRVLKRYRLFMKYLALTECEKNSRI